MTYLEYIPPFHLSNYIDKLWYCESADLSNSTQTIPILHHELVINFTDEYYISSNEDFSNAIAKPHSWISGIQTKPSFTKSAGKHEMLGVLFKPMGLNAFTQIDSSEFKDTYVDASSVFGNGFLKLLQELQDKGSPKSKILKLACYLTKLLTVKNRPSYLIASLDLLKQQVESRTFIKDVCSQLSISNKSLIKTYHKHIGVSPMKYYQLYQVNRALFQLSTEPQQSLTDLAYDLNFFDQSHFINAFKLTSGITPSQYAKHILNGNTDSLSPNFIALEG